MEAAAMGSVRRASSLAFNQRALRGMLQSSSSHFPVSTTSFSILNSNNNNNNFSINSAESTLPPHPRSARAASTTSSSTASGLGGLDPYLPTTAGSRRSRPYLSYVEQVRASALLKARVHLGHRHGQTNAKLTGLLQGIRHNIAIYDINRTWRSMRTVFYAFAEMAQHRSSFFLLAPNPNLPLRGVIESMRKTYPFRHDRFGSLYMTGYADKKWVDGIFSNWKVTYEYARHVRDVLDTKPALRKYRKLSRYLRGVEDTGLYAKIIPDFVLVLATDRGALHEARNADIPLIGMVDTNTDPSPFLYPIYANDDSIESVQFVLDLVKRGVEEGRKREQEMFALLMVRKLKQALDPVRGTSFGLLDLAKQQQADEASSRSGSSSSTNGRDGRDAWTPRPSVMSERPAWYNKLDVQSGGNVRLDSVVTK